MANIAAIECFDELLRSVTSSDRAFGDKVLIGIGDFRQVAPVVKGGGVTATLNASIKSSSLWKFFCHFHLTAPQRNAMDPEFSAFVDSVGDGYNMPLVRLDRYIRHTSVFEDALSFIFPPDILLDPITSMRRSFLTPLNEFVDEINLSLLSRLPSQQSMFSPLWF